MMFRTLSGFIVLTFASFAVIAADCATEYELPPDSWRQIGLPCAPPPEQSSLRDILADDMGAQARYNFDWVVYGYDPASNRYIAPEIDDPIEPGMGYWIYNATGATRILSMPPSSQPLAPNFSRTCPAADSLCIDIALDYSSERAGNTQFNMISVPTSSTVAWGDLSVADNQLCATATGCTLAEANDKQVMSDIGYRYNGERYITIDTNSLLPSWNGLWIRLLSQAQPDSELRLQLPSNESHCPIFPPDNPWNQDISELPVHPNSDNYVRSIGADGRAHADFGTVYNGAPNGIPYINVTPDTPRRNVAFLYADESDTGPYPIPDDPAIEGGPNGTGDRHILMLDRLNCTLYELFYAWPPGGQENPYNDRWYAGSGAVFDLRSNTLRPDFWTSADAAGLPIYPGLVKYQEAVIDKEIHHALRFTTRRTQRAFIYPATHFASSSTDPDLPPMGLRVRLKADFNIEGYAEEVQVILRALKTYGMLLADNGSDWFISGAPDPRWNDDNLRQLRSIPGSAFEAVYTGELITE